MSTDGLTRGVAFWLAEHYNADEWDCLTGDEKAGYLGQAEELLRYVAEPLTEVSSRPGPAVTASYTGKARDQAARAAFGAYSRSTAGVQLDRWCEVVDAVAAELGVSVPASPADDGSGT